MAVADSPTGKPLSSAWYLLCIPVLFLAVAFVLHLHPSLSDPCPCA